MDQKFALTKQRQELLHALERARTRLAVAVAAESKSTPLDRWQYYLETADRMRRFAKQLRTEEFNREAQAGDWGFALHALRQLPVQNTAWPLCRFLAEILAKLE